MRRLALWLTTGAIVGTAMAASAFGQQAAQERRDQAQMRGAQTGILKASDLIGKDVENRQGDDLGDIHDLAIDPQTGRVKYVVLSHGGVLGIGDKLFAVPWQAVRTSLDRDTVLLDIPKERFKDAPGFNEDNWPNMANPQWAREVHQFYGVEMEREADMTRPGQIERQRGLDLDVDREGVQQRDRSRMQQQNQGSQQRMQQGTQQPTDQEYRVRIERESDAMQNPPRQESQQQGETVVKGQQESGDQQYRAQVQRNQDQSGMQQSRQGQVDLQQHFNAQQVQPVSGRIVSVTRQTDATDDSVKVTLRTDEGQTHVVYLAPESYLSRQSVNLQQGQELSVRGSRAQVRGQTAYIAQQVTVDGHQVQLRNSEGQPQWRSQAQTAQRGFERQQGQRSFDEWQDRDSWQSRGQDRDDLYGAQAQRDRQQEWPSQAFRDREQMQQRDRQQAGGYDMDARRGSTVGPAGQGGIAKAGDLIGKSVVNSQGEDLGEIEEIVLDLDRGQVAYAVLSHGGFLSIGDKLHAIPWRALRLSPDGDEFVLNVSEKELEQAEGFDKNNWPNMANPRWASAVHERYNVEPYWSVDVDNQQGRRDQMRAWQRQQDSTQQRQVDLEQHFNADQLRTIRGEVVRVVRQTDARDDSIGVILRTDDGRSMPVYLVPQQELSRQNVNLRPGQQLTVQGSMAQVQGRQALIAQQLNVDNQQIQLRSREGEVQVQMQRGGQQRQPQDRLQQQSDSQRQQRSSDEWQDRDSWQQSGQRGSGNQQGGY